MTSTKKDTAELMRILRKEHGCDCQQAKRSGHWHIRLPSGELVVAAKTSGGGRGYLNLLALLRRKGIRL